MDQRLGHGMEHSSQECVVKMSYLRGAHETLCKRSEVWSSGMDEKNTGLVILRGRVCEESVYE